jgi:ribosomal protein S18 acetylase RimI-like enzyme
MISISRLTPADAGLLATIGGATLIQSHGHSAPPEIMQEYVHKSFSHEACSLELQDKHNTFHAAYYDGQPAGYSKIILASPHPAVPLQPVTKLERLYLLQEFYDRKIGHHLLQHALSLSKAAGEKGMWLNVWKENGRAIRFYQKAGFQIVGESRFVLTPTHANPNWVMLLAY